MQADGSEKSILLVDDEDGGRAYLKDLLNFYTPKPIQPTLLRQALRKIFQLEPSPAKLAVMRPAIAAGG